MPRQWGIGWEHSCRTRDVPVEKNKVAFGEKPNSSPQAPRPKAMSHLFWPFAMGPPWAALEL